MATKKSATKRKKLTLQNLNIWNKRLAAVYFIEAVAILVFSKTSSFPIIERFLTKDTLTSEVAGHTVLAPASQHLLDINMVYLVIAFLLVPVIIHLLAAFRYRLLYETDIKHTTNRLRWIDFGLSSGLMMVAIALLNGANDTAILLAVFVLMLVAHASSYLMELHNPVPRVSSWLSYLISCLAGLAPWLIIAIYIKGNLLYGEGRLPGFVYAVDSTLFLLAALSGLNLYFIYKQKGRWAEYLYGERIYMFLGLATKTALAALIFVGTLR